LQLLKKEEKIIKYIIIVNGFKIQNSSKKYEYCKNIFGLGKFSMLFDDSIKPQLDEVKQLYNEGK
jgi:hypothetical protein